MTYPNKLQTQVEYLDNNKECQICFYKPSIVFENNVTEEQKKQDEILFEHLSPKTYTRREIYEKWTILTGTVVYRNPNVKYHFSSKIDIVDTYFFLSLMTNGTADCIDIEGTAYRRTGNNYSSNETSMAYLKKYYQYKYYASAMPDLVDFSKEQQHNCLKFSIYNNNDYNTWKCRFLYMWWHKRLFFTSFFTTTILSYMIKPLIKRFKKNIIIN